MNKKDVNNHEECKINVVREEENNKEKPVEGPIVEQKKEQREKHKVEPPKGANEEKKTEEKKAEEKKTEVSNTKESKTKKTRIKIVFWSNIAAIIVLLLGGYITGVIYYQKRFFPCTYINGNSCENKNAQETVALLQEQLLDEYKITVIGRDIANTESNAKIGVISAKEIEMEYENINTVIEDLLITQNHWTWPKVLLRKNENAISIMESVSFDENKVAEVVKSWDACQQKNMTTPQNAYIGDYDKLKNQYVIIPETKGTKLDINLLIEVLKSQIVEQKNEVNIEEYGCYKEATITATNQKLLSSIEEVNKWLKTEIIYDWNNNEVVLDAEVISTWISFENNTFVLNTQSIEEFVKENAIQYDTYGKKKEFITALGETITLKSPNYGWKTDVQSETEELTQLIYNGSTIAREPVYSIKAKKKGINDIGNSYVEADLTRQHLYVVEKGEIVFETDFVSGTLNSTPDCITPEGIFGLTYKTTDAVLRGANYASHVNYWMPFYGNYGMHDATWRVNFGGTIFQQHGSHGCINLPLESAEVVYQYVEKGSPVICYYHQHNPYAQIEVSTEQNVEYTDEQLEQEHEPTF